MAIAAPHGYVTSKGWGVSVQTTVPGEPAILNVSRFADGFGVRPGDADSRAFPDRDAAWEYAQSHGYVEAYRPTRGVWKSQHRALCKALADQMRYFIINNAESRADVLRESERVRDIARDAGCDLLDSAVFSIAAHTIAQRFRPELLQRRRRK
jgi:hypothetical protein